MGGITLVDKAEKISGLISGVFSCTSNKAKDFEARVKLLLYNRLTYAVSVHHILETYPKEIFGVLGFRKEPSVQKQNARNRGEMSSILLKRYQKILYSQKTWFGGR